MPPPADAQDALETDLQQLRQTAPVPAIWLFGKTGSGKSSVIRYLTGAEAAIVGEGYRPETKSSQRFDFPNTLDRLLTFVDTRGLGEASYDPTADIAHFDGTTQLMLVTVRAGDHALQGILEPLQRIRRACPQRPVLLLLTCLHEIDGAMEIAAAADPFEEISSSSLLTLDKNSPAGNVSQAAATTIPPALATQIERKLSQFRGLVDGVVPIDLTQPEDGFSDPNFGGQRLKKAILNYLPHAYRQALLVLNNPLQVEETQRQRKARWQVLASSALAGTAGAVPIPWVDIPAVLGIQTHLATKLAQIYRQELTAAHWAVLSSAAGSRIAVRMAFREALKFIPFVGMAAGAASSFAFTYALGMSWDWYFSGLRQGGTPTAEELKKVFDQQLQRGRELWEAE
ncbi:hypothetical protein Q31a_14190 [Aureliella helgolandensis]|uniref:G domain-containing protein n=2 Tax=Aureliella helgolandensis TaxID=2527968 RepID=A0A518G3F1_9BACT|nr:hypothetical protein Q31a_14190 [Aureliella helgolandensis]